MWLSAGYGSMGQLSSNRQWCSLRWRRRRCWQFRPCTSSTSGVLLRPTRTSLRLADNELAIGHVREVPKPGNRRRDHRYCCRSGHDMVVAPSAQDEVKSSRRSSFRLSYERHRNVGDDEGKAKDGSGA